MSVTVSDHYNALSQTLIVNGHEVVELVARPLKNLRQPAQVVLVRHRSIVRKNGQLGVVRRARSVRSPTDDQVMLVGVQDEQGLCVDDTASLQHTSSSSTKY